MARTIVSDELIEALRDNLGAEPWNVRRVVIDIEAGSIPIVHIEQYGDDRLINVVRALDGVRVDWSDPTR